MENREEYQGKMEAQLSELGAELDKLTARADKAKADTMQGYHDQIEDLRSKQASIHVKLQEIKTSGVDLKEGLNHSWDQLKDAYTKSLPGSSKR